MENKIKALENLCNHKNEIINFLLGIYGQPNETASPDEAMIYQELLQQEQKLAGLLQSLD